MINLQRLFGNDTPQRQICTVVGRVAVGRYRLHDRLSRIVEADSSDSWRPGETVVVQYGRIVGQAAPGETEIVEG